MMNKAEKFFDTLFETGGNILLSFIRRLAPFAVPLAPAFFLAHAVATAAGSLETPAWGTAVGIVAAVGLESAGIMGAHLAVKFYSQRNEKWTLAVAATAAYLIIGVSTIWLLDGATVDGKLVGTAMFLIAGIVYLLLGLSEDAAHGETAVRDDRQFEHDMAYRKLQLAHEEKLARIAAKAAAQSANPATQETQKSAEETQTTKFYECACGKVFARPQSYSAHTRHCTSHRKLAAQNGYGGTK